MDEMMKYNGQFTAEQRKAMAAEMLRTQRKLKKLSQKEVAAYLNIPATTYNTYESGRTEPPIEMLVRLSWLYDVPVDFIVQRDKIALTIEEQTKQLQDFKAQFAEMNERMKDSTKVTPEIMAMWQAMGALVDSTLDYAQQQSDKQ